MTENEKIASLNEQVSLQQTKLLDLERTAKTAKSLTVLAGAGGAILTALVAAVGAYVSLNDEVRVWNSIKSAHVRNESGSDVYDHKIANDKAVKKAVELLALPDATEIVLKSDLPDLSEYLKSVDLKTELTNPDILSVVSDGIDGKWPEGDYCILRSGSCPANFSTQRAGMFGIYMYAGEAKFGDNAQYLYSGKFGDSYVSWHGEAERKKIPGKTGTADDGDWHGELMIHTCCQRR